MKETISALFAALRLCTGYTQAAPLPTESGRVRFSMQTDEFTTQDREQLDPHEPMVNFRSTMPNFDPPAATTVTLYKIVALNDLENGDLALMRLRNPSVNGRKEEKHNRLATN